ncbi:metabolite traffic protein EboE [Galbibacter sp. PAP.153]|uniref:metabolite traffic protein EboE n=1 Tax=Galbibacter sp. PAP.153 TaxID=3104623 RepID=UPI00300BD93D
MSYCTNVHSGETWDEVFQVLNAYIPYIKQSTVGDNPFGISLRLSNKACQQLYKNNNLDIFKDWLHHNNLYVFCINGFVYGNMHTSTVKDFVYAPDWASFDRLSYTKDLIFQLQELLPKGISGSITTSPLGYRYWYHSEKITENCFKKAAYNLIEIVWELYQVECNTGKYIHLDIEPEPNSLLENSNQVIHYFREYLLPTGQEIFKRRTNKTSDEIESMILKYINICYNVGHFCMAYESPEISFRRFKQTGIKVGKIQMSSVLKFLLNDSNKASILDYFSTFNQERFLHQASEKIGDTVITYPDLWDVIKKHQNIQELRTQFNVPIYMGKHKFLQSTQAQLVEVINYIKENNICEHIEVETYTWELLPLDIKTDLATSIIKELHWLKARLEGTVLDLR